MRKIIKSVSRSEVEEKPLWFLYCKYSQRYNTWSTVVDGMGETVAHVLARSVPTQALEVWIGDDKFHDILQLQDCNKSTVAHMLAMCAPRLSRLVFVARPDVLIWRNAYGVSVGDLLRWR